MNDLVTKSVREVDLVTVLQRCPGVANDALVRHLTLVVS